MKTPSFPLIIALQFYYFYLGNTFPVKSYHFTPSSLSNPTIAHNENDTENPQYNIYNLMNNALYNYVQNAETVLFDQLPPTDPDARFAITSMLIHQYLQRQEDQILKEGGSHKEAA